MTLEQVALRSTPNTLRRVKALLIVGPQPPPMGGATLTVQILLEELAGYDSVEAALVDTRLPTNYRKKKSLFELQTIRRAFFIIKQYLNKIGNSDATLVFANNTFILTLAPLLFLLARWHHKPFYLKPVGGDLDLYVMAQAKPLRHYLLYVLRALDGILPQTRQLEVALNQFGCTNTRHIPGCRPNLQISRSLSSNSETLHLIFLSQIKPEKGVQVLLDALRLLTDYGVKVTCDFYGPIYQEYREAFFLQLERLPNARYCGVVEAGAAPQIMAQYDVLVLPTYFVSEGHPGVIIEAMQVGLPIITTQHRAIPELVTHGENGLLVPIQNSRALADAIRHLALTPLLKAQMSQASYRKGQAFQASVIVPQILNFVFHEGCQK